MDTLTTIKTAEIRPNPNNPRRKTNADELAELAASIKAVGMLQPITVRLQYATSDIVPVGDAYYEIVCGHRRFEAAKLAGLDRVPCIIRILSDDEAYEVMVTENLQRKDIDPFDESAAFCALKARGYDVQALADKFGKSQSYIYARIKLSNLIPEFVERYGEGTIQLSHCLMLAKLEKAEQKKVLEKYYCGDYYDLSKRSSAELRDVIMRNAIDLDHQYIDTTECEGCENNTASGAIFPEQCSAKCTNPECFGRKYADAVIHYFREAREANPDFFIIQDNASRFTNSYDPILAQRLRDEGFKFIEAKYWDYEEIEDRKNKFDHKGQAACFGFGWSGMLGPKKEVKEYQATPRKDNWTLDRLAATRQSTTREIRNGFAIDKIIALDDADMFEQSTADMATAMRAALYILAANADSTVSANGLTGSSDEEAAKAAIDGMRTDELTMALAKFSAVALNDESLDTAYAERMFPKQFANLEEAVEKKYLDKCRKAWTGYAEVTDQMIEEDLAERMAKIEAEEE